MVRSEEKAVKPWEGSGKSSGIRILEVIPLVCSGLLLKATVFARQSCATVERAPRGSAPPTESGSRRPAPMNSVALDGPGAGPGRPLLCSVFTYLYEQSRRPDFRAWQIGLGPLTPSYHALHAFAIFQGSSSAPSFVSSLFLLGLGTSGFISTRLIRDRSGPALV